MDRRSMFILFLSICIISGLAFWVLTQPPETSAPILPVMEKSVSEEPATAPPTEVAMDCDSMATELTSLVNRFDASSDTSFAQCVNKLCDEVEPTMIAILELSRQNPGCDAMVDEFVDQRLPEGYSMGNIRVSLALKQNMHEKLSELKSQPPQSLTEWFLSLVELDSNNSWSLSTVAEPKQKQIAAEMARLAPQNAVAQHQIIRHCLDNSSEEYCNQVPALQEHIRDGYLMFLLAEFYFKRGDKAAADAMLTTASDRNFTTQLHQAYFDLLDRSLRSHQEPFSIWHHTTYVQLITQSLGDLAVAINGPCSLDESKKSLCDTAFDTWLLTQEPITFATAVQSRKKLIDQMPAENQDAALTQLRTIHNKRQQTFKEESEKLVSSALKTSKVALTTAEFRFYQQAISEQGFFLADQYLVSLMQNRLNRSEEAYSYQ